MFMDDFGRKTGSRPTNEFFRYCRDEGLDWQLLLSRLNDKKKEQDAKLQRKNGRYAPHKVPMPRLMPENQ